MTPQPIRRALRLVLLLGVLVLTAACAVSSSGPRPMSAGETLGPGTPAAGLRLGYFPNVTHATAIYGVETGLFADALGSTRLTTQTFNAGPAAVEALFAGAVDAAYLGPNPAVNAFARSRGAAVRIVAGAASGGAALVTSPQITRIEQLRGTTIATPQMGGTQDVALRTLLADNGFEVDLRGAGDVSVQAQDNGVTLRAFQAGDIDGAWVPEPWVSRLVLEAGGRVLVDESSLWPGGRFPTTLLVVRTEYLRAHPGTVEALVRGSVEANRRIEADLDAAKDVVNAALAELTGKPLAPETLDRAFAQLEFTNDPLASALQTSAKRAHVLGFVVDADLRGILELAFLREALGTEIDDAGLGKG